MELDYEKIIKRFEVAKGRKLLWESHLRECYQYALPERNTIDYFSPGSRKRQRLFDDTAVDALEDFASRLTYSLVPANTKWMKLEAGSDVPKNEKEEIDTLLEETTETLFNHLNSSNFVSQVNESFLDLGISTGAIVCEEGDGIQSSLNFRSVSLSELILENSSLGIIETVFREFKIPAKDVKDKWKNAKLSEALMQTIKNTPTQEVELIEATLKEENIFYSLLIYPKEKTFLINIKLDYNPFIVFRESTISGEVYGRGRVMRQLNNIKTLNRMVEDYLKGLSFQANPIFLASDDGILNPYTVRVRPGVVLPVGTNDRGSPSLTTLPMAGNPQLMDFAIRNYQDQIRRALLSKPFGSIEETPVRSATEMSIRNADQAATTLSASSRVQSELLERIIANSIAILKKAGKVGDMKVNGREVKIKFVNPSTRQQDESVLASYGRFMEIVQAFPPELIAQKIKVEDIPVEIAKTVGLPASILRDEDEVAEIQQVQAQQAQAEQGITQEKEIQDV